MKWNLKRGNDYETGEYAREREDLMYYRYFELIMRCVAGSARSLIDVGTGNVPYLERLDWIPTRISVDMDVPYASQRVKAIRGDITKLSLPRYDVCTCLQVLEHIPEVELFARRLLELGSIVVVSVPHRWPKGKTPGHVHDPVDDDKLNAWFGRTANYRLLVREPFLRGARLFALYDQIDPSRVYGHEVWANRRRSTQGAPR